ncbi:MAG: hypothetical protein AAGC74_02365 [Verrucomicrobiota bacterium]
MKGSSFLSRVCLLWAGVVIGGSLIAAPSKFQVEELTMPVALLVGRAQFGAVAVGEGILIGMGILGALLGLKFKRSTSGLSWGLFLGAVAIFLIQHLVLMGPLQERSERIIAGEDIAQGSHHLVYIVVEVMKVGLLVLGGFWRVVRGGKTS